MDENPKAPVMSRHVTVCSKNPAVVTAVSRASDRHRYRLTVCESGLEVLGLVRVIASDLVILDLETPGLSGLLLVSALKELVPGLPIVAVSTNPAPDARAISQKGVAYASLGSRPDDEVHALLTRLARTQGSGPAAGAGATR